MKTRSDRPYFHLRSHDITPETEGSLFRLNERQGDSTSDRVGISTKSPNRSSRVSVRTG